MNDFSKIEGSGLLKTNYGNEPKDPKEDASYIALKKRREKISRDMKSPEEKLEDIDE